MSSKSQKVGTLWELSVESKNSVTFEVAGPTGIRRVSARPQGKKQTAHFILDAPGDFSATAVIDGADNVGGFAVTAK